MTCLVRCPPLVASSAGEGQEVMALPAVGHDVLGPNPPLAAVRAEVDPVLGVATEWGVVPDGDVDSVVGDRVECHRTSAASQLHTARGILYGLENIIWHLITPSLGPIGPELYCRVFLPVIGLNESDEILIHSTVILPAQCLVKDLQLWPSIAGPVVKQKFFRVWDENWQKHCMYCLLSSTDLTLFVTQTQLYCML